MKLLLILFSLLSLNSFACPEMNDIDLSGYEVEEKYEVLSSGPIVLEEYEFNQIPNFANDNFIYDECKESLTSKVLKSKISGKIYTAIITNDDDCDGGNSYGALFYKPKKEVLADINDGGIYCY